ncbi:MAG TPA: hypothetical protein VMS65_14890 [Polyangiaceae bacterium]|nr:hypothetical protein [Polyangiaceae bacterium]
MACGGKLVVVALLILASGCEKSGICAGKPLALEISGNHGHEERIAASELEKRPGRYAIAGGTHEHGFRLSEADLAKLRTGGSLELRSTSMNAHVHALRIECAR